MAGHHGFIIIFTIILAVLPSTTLAKDFVVGDERGWTPGFDYKIWTDGKIFLVGDRLVFRYEAGNHNVYKVNGTDFKNCDVPTDSEPLSTGNDTIVLATPGRKWYICGVGQHCELGQKLFITVQESAPTPFPHPVPSYPVASPPSPPSVPSDPIASPPSPPSAPSYPVAPTPSPHPVPCYPVASPPSPPSAPSYPDPSPLSPPSDPGYPISSPPPTPAVPSPAVAPSPYYYMRKRLVKLIKNHQI